MATFRWIDARKGTLEIKLNDSFVGDTRVLYLDKMKVKMRVNSADSWYSTLRTIPLRFEAIGEEDACLWGTHENQLYHLVNTPEDCRKLVEYYQTWLARVMLADDISKSRAEERQDDPATDEGSQAHGEKVGVEGVAAPLPGNDRHKGRGFRPSEKNVPVVPREQSWKIRPR